MTKKKRREVDIIVFFENINAQLKFCQKSIEHTEQQIAQLIELAGMVNKDRLTYNLKFFFNEDGMEYERTKRKKIGF